MTESDLFLPLIADGEDKTSILANRIRKNYRHIRKWAKRTLTNCFRIYDKEIPKHPLAIDFYAGHFCVQYFARKGESGEPSDDVIQETESALRTVFGIDKKSIFWRTRMKTKETRQYEKLDETKQFIEVLEYGVKFKVNLLDYLDTGLFLDHRETRHLVSQKAKDKHILNLFAYTCSFSVHAAMKGAAFTKSVDMSNTYTEWGRDNFVLNGLSSKNNVIVRADCLKFLVDEASTPKRYDIIIIDPPTISRSKKMTQMFDIQIDYIFLINKSLQLIKDEGVIYFSTNSRKFHFNEPSLKGCKIQDISEKTLPIDFQDKKIHRCWKISKIKN